MNRTSSRRSFLKSGAIVAAPLAVMAPAPVFAADDGSKTRLARLEDEKTLAAMHRDVMRQAERGERTLAPGLSALTADPAHDLQIAFADNGLSAICRRACTASFRTEFTGTSTIERMHRLQGQGLHAHDEARVLVAEYRKGKDGWSVEGLRLV